MATGGMRIALSISYLESFLITSTLTILIFLHDSDHFTKVIKSSCCLLEVALSTDQGM